MANPRSGNEPEVKGKEPDAASLSNGSGSNGSGANGRGDGKGHEGNGSIVNPAGGDPSPESIYADSTLAAAGPLSPYDDDLSTLSALPAPRLEDSLQVWEPPSPTAWRKNAVSHAGSAIMGGIVAVGAFIAFGPKRVVHVTDPRPLVTLAPPTPNPGMVPGLNGMNPPVPFGPQGPGVNGAAPNLPPGAKLPGAAANPMPNVKPGTGVPVPPANPSGSQVASVNLPRGGGSIPPLPKGVTIPNLTDAPPPQVFSAKGVPVLPPGYINQVNVGRPPAGLVQANGANGFVPPPPVTAKGPRVKGPLAPGLKGYSTIAKVIGSPPTSPNDAGEDTDRAIDRLKRAAEANPKDPVAQLQLEKAYRKKLIQADRVDEMEHYRALADDARDKAKTILTNDGAKPAPKAATPPPAPPAEQKPAPKAPEGESKPAAPDEAKPASPPS
jgi:hypothetical protein